MRICACSALPSGVPNRERSTVGTVSHSADSRNLSKGTAHARPSRGSLSSRARTRIGVAAARRWAFWQRAAGRGGGREKVGRLVTATDGMYICSDCCRSDLSVCLCLAGQLSACWLYQASILVMAVAISLSVQLSTCHREMTCSLFRSVCLSATSVLLLPFLFPLASSLAEQISSQSADMQFP